MSFDSLILTFGFDPNLPKVTLDLSGVTPGSDQHREKIQATVIAILQTPKQGESVDPADVHSDATVDASLDNYTDHDSISETGSEVLTDSDTYPIDNDEETGSFPDMEQRLMLRREGRAGPAARPPACGGRKVDSGVIQGTRTAPTPTPESLVTNSSSLRHC